MMQKHTLANHNHNKHRQRCRDGSLSCYLNSSHNHWHTTISRAIPTLSLFSLAALTILALSPNVTRSVYADEPTSYANDNNVSLIISGSTDQETAASTVKPTFRSHNITATASHIESYSLTISYADGSDSLKNDAASTTVVKDLSANTIGSNIPDNTWGWSWSEDTTTADAAMTYRPLKTTPTVIKSDSNPSGYAANISGKLAFGAKFAEGADAGHYQAGVLISFAAEPRAVIDMHSITYMQDMTTEICTNSTVNDTATLIDRRDNKSYTIAKIQNVSDGIANCWMTQNLALINTQLDGAYSDIVSGNFTVPASNVSGFTSSDVNSPKAYLQSSYGGYYNWYTATAGFGNNSITSTNTTIASSICPKNWQLPPNSGNKSFTNLTSGKTTGAQVVVAPYKLEYGGFVYSGSYRDQGVSGSYWTSTSYSGTHAYYMEINSAEIKLSRDSERLNGRAVRCVAR